MKRLTKSTVIGTKRKQAADNKENDNSLDHENSNPPQQSQLSSYKTSRPFCGVFHASLSTPLSVLTNGYSETITNLIKKPSSRLIDANNGSASDGRNLHSDFNECSEQEDIIQDVLPDLNYNTVPCVSAIKACCHPIPFALETVSHFCEFHTDAARPGKKKTLVTPLSRSIQFSEFRVGSEGGARSIPSARLHFLPSTGIDSCS
nr:uncharacterized protein LOC109170955 [Ipomoea batatas]